MASNEGFRLLADPNVEIIAPTAEHLEHLPATRRVTRSLTGRTPAPTPAPQAAPPKPKPKPKPKATATGGASSSHPNSPTYPIIIEFCKSDEIFLEKAMEVKKGIEAAAFPDVVVRNRKSRSSSGCFEIWFERTGHIFISHVGLKKPYKELTDIKVNEVVETIALYLKNRPRRALKMRAINGNPVVIY